jgi:hypothetical protein
MSLTYAESNPVKRAIVQMADSQTRLLGNIYLGKICLGNICLSDTLSQHKASSYLNMWICSLLILISLHNDRSIFLFRYMSISLYCYKVICLLYHCVTIEWWRDSCLCYAWKVGIVYANIFLFTSWHSLCLWQAKNKSILRCLQIERIWYCLSRAGRSVALNEAERANAQMLFETKKLFALVKCQCRIITGYFWVSRK